MHRFLPLMFGLLCCVWGMPRAQGQIRPDETGLYGWAVTGLAAIPTYEGSSEMQFLPYFGGRLQYGHQYLQVDGLVSRVNLLGVPLLEIGPVSNITPSRAADQMGDQLSGFEDVSAAVELGGYLAWTLMLDAYAQNSIRFQLQAQRDVTDAHNGAQAVGAVYGMWTPSPSWVLGLEGSVVYADQAYMRTYFGVNETAAQASNLSVFRPGGGVREVGLIANASARLTDHWWLNLVAGNRMLVGEAADSPVIQQGGSIHGWAALAGISYNF